MQAIAKALFGNCGYVPDVASLQAWLECAWTAGFDPMGAEQLGRCASFRHQQHGRLSLKLGTPWQYGVFL